MLVVQKHQIDQAAYTPSFGHIEIRFVLVAFAALVVASAALAVAFVASVESVAVPSDQWKQQRLW